MEINIKVPAIEKLLEATVSGIGTIGGPMLARWRARTEANALRIKAQGQAAAVRLIADAQAEARKSFDIDTSSVQGELGIRNEIEARLSFQEEKRQSNIKAVVGMAAEEVGEKEVPDQEIDHDWTARFFADVQDVSSEQMQQIWAKILAGEVEKPGRTSLRTLSILKDMTRKDAELFAHVAQFIIRDFIFHDESTESIPEFPKLEPLLQLSCCGLLHVDRDLSHSFYPNLDFRSWLTDKRIAFSISSKDKNDAFKISIPTYVLTDSGKELYESIECQKNWDYLGALANFLETKSFKLEYAEILAWEEGGVKVGPWLQVAPRIPPEQNQNEVK